MHGLDELASREQAEAGAADSRAHVDVDAVERVEHARVVGRVDAGPVVGDGDGDRPADAGSADHDRRFAVLDGVLHEHGDHADEGAAVGEHDRALGHVDADVRQVAGTLGQRHAHPAQRIVDHAVEAGRADRHLHALVGELVVGEERVGDLLEVVCVFANDRHELHALALGELQLGVHERVCEPEDGGDRRAQLVRGGRHEVALGLLEQVGGGGVAERLQHATARHHGDHDVDHQAAAATTHGQRDAARARGAFGCQQANDRIVDVGALARQAGELLGAAVPELDVAIEVPDADALLQRLERAAEREQALLELADLLVELRGQLVDAAREVGEGVVAAHRHATAVVAVGEGAHATGEQPNGAVGEEDDEQERDDRRERHCADRRAHVAADLRQRLVLERGGRQRVQLDGRVGGERDGVDVQVVAADGDVVQAGLTGLERAADVLGRDRLGELVAGDQERAVTLERDE